MGLGGFVFEVDNVGQDEEGDSSTDSSEIAKDFKDGPDAVHLCEKSSRGSGETEFFVDLASCCAFNSNSVSGVKIHFYGRGCIECEELCTKCVSIHSFSISRHELSPRILINQLSEVKILTSNFTTTHRVLIQENIDCLSSGINWDWVVLWVKAWFAGHFNL